MARANPPGLTKDVDRHGNVRWYVRRPGGKRKIRIRETYGTPAFWSVYRDAMAGKIAPSPRPGAGRPKADPTSWRGLLDRYFASAEFKALDARTQKVRRAILERFALAPSKTGEPFGALPFGLMKPKHIRAIRDAKAETPGAANGLLKALRQAYAFAVDNDLTDANPAKEVPNLPPVRAEGIAPWTDEHVARFKEKHPLGSMARLALVLFEEFGQRISDVYRLGPPMVDGDVITFVQTKNSRRNPVTLSLPIPLAVREALDATPHGTTTWLVNDYGHSFASVNAFGNKFRDWCRAAGITDRSAHGLRKYFSARLADHGASDREIMAFTGHKTAKEVDRYTRSANQKRLAKAARTKLDGSTIVPLFPENSDGGTKQQPKSLTENEKREDLVPQAGLEPARSREQQILSLPRLPFRHWGSGARL